MLLESLNLWTLVWMKPNIAWKCICPTLLKFLRGKVIVNILYPFFIPIRMLLWLLCILIFQFSILI
jgi:hypothetical protein